MTRLKLLLKPLACIVCMASFGGTVDRSDTASYSDDVVVQSGETNGVKLEVEMRRAYSPAESIGMKFTLYNNRSDTIILNHTDERGDIFMQLEDYHHIRVPLTDLGNKFDIGDPYEYGKNLQLRLGPHESMKWHYNLGSYFKLSEKGQYRLSVIRTVDGTDKDHHHCGEDQEVDVGPVRFWLQSK